MCLLLTTYLPTPYLRWLLVDVTRTNSLYKPLVTGRMYSFKWSLLAKAGCPYIRIQCTWNLPNVYLYRSYSVPFILDSVNGQGP